jgi:SAM-dependent methyltransferase
LYHFEDEEERQVIQRQTKFWSIAAPAWKEHEQVVETWLKPITERLVVAMPDDPDALVLDAGCGRCTLPLACRVVGVDLTLPMLDPAKVVVRGDCTTLPFQSQAFDGAVSRLALMLVPSPRVAFAEIARVLKPGSPFAFAVWGQKERNGWRAVEEAITSHLGIREPRPDEPHIWRLSDPQEVVNLLESAGLAEIRFDTISVDYFERLSAEDAFQLIVSLGGGLSHLWSQVADADREAVRRRALEALSDRRGEAHVFVCRKPFH